MQADSSTGVALGVGVIGVVWLLWGMTDVVASSGTQPATSSRPAKRLSTSQPTTGPVWPRPRFTARRDERHRMVERQIARGQQPVRDERVLAAMRHVPRHAFVPSRYRDSAYDDSPLPIGYKQTISQPLMVACMTEALKLEPGEKVLEIGTGCGYQAAVLAELTPHVFTIEIVEPLAKQATRRLERLGYRTVTCKAGDGFVGWPEHAPFDAIIVTCAPPEVPKPLLDQLADGGRLVIPVGGEYQVQHLLLIVRHGNDLVRHKLMPVRFVPMTGETQRQYEVRSEK